MLVCATRSRLRPKPSLPPAPPVGASVLSSRASRTSRAWGAWPFRSMHPACGCSRPGRRFRLPCSTRRERSRGPLLIAASLPPPRRGVAFSRIPRECAARRSVRRGYPTPLSSDVAPDDPEYNTDSGMPAFWVRRAPARRWSSTAARRIRRMVGDERQGWEVLAAPWCDRYRAENGGRSGQAR